MSARLGGKFLHAFVVPTPSFASSALTSSLSVGYKVCSRSISSAPPRPLIRNRCHMSQQTPLPSTGAPAPDASATASTTPPDAPAPPDPTVQYVVVRRDLLETWPTGSVIAQAVHASVAAIWESKGSSLTSAYCGQPGNGTASGASPQMHTVVLEAKNEAALLKLAARLEEANVRFAMWKEQPEDFVTALAAWPYPRTEVKKHFSKFKLFK